MVDKPGRRKKRKVPWGRIVAVSVLIVIIGVASWYVYWADIYRAPPVYAKLGTSQGYIYAELFPSCAPQTVANFVNLTQSGFYNDLVWHRIVPGFVIQTGDPNTRGAQNSTRSSWGHGNSGHSVPFEWCGYIHHGAGTFGMASTSAKGPSTSQFFIDLSNSTSVMSLDDNYTAFGRVISGMSVACAIANPTTDPTYPSNSNFFSQPVNLSSALLNNVTIITASQAPTFQANQAC